jgi:hypothetical protein
VGMDIPANMRHDPMMFDVSLRRDKTNTSTNVIEYDSDETWWTPDQPIACLTFMIYPNNPPSEVYFRVPIEAGMREIVYNATKQ